MTDQMKKRNVIGSWAFLIGFILAVVLGILGDVTTNDTVLLVLVVLGIIAGLLNIADEETTSFLMSGVVLIIAGALGGKVVENIALFNNILNAVLALFVPATIIVAVKNVFTLARD